jgi:disulfide bond formation protein DsbB
VISAAVFSGASILLRFNPENLGLTLIIIFLMIVSLVACVLGISHTGRNLLANQTGSDPEIWGFRVAWVLVGFIASVIGSAF